MNGSATASTQNAENSSEEPLPKEAESPLVPNRLVRAAAWLHVAHNGMMIDKIRRQNHIVQKQVKGMVSETGADMSDDDMGDLSVGNEIHNHYTQTEKSGSSPLAKMLAMGLLGAGLGVGGLLLGNYLAEDKDTDTDTSVEVGLGKIEDYLKQE